MIPEVSEEYKIEMRRQGRGRQFIKINFGLLNEEAQKEVVATADEIAIISSVKNIAKTDYSKKYDYASCENGGIVLGKGQLIAPDSLGQSVYKQGFISNALSNENGIFEIQPIITMEFKSTHDFSGLKLVFDDILNRYPKTIKIEAQYLGIIVFEETYEIDNSTITLEDNINEVDLLKIYYLETIRPFQRARLSYIEFGIGITFNDDVLDSGGAIRIEDIDPLMRRLPEQTFSFSFLDPNKEYDVENPNGIWKYVNIHNPIEVEYEQRLKDGGSEFINGGKFYLDSSPIVNKQKVTMNATSKLSQLNDIFYSSQTFKMYWYPGGTIYKEPISYYLIATHVLRDAGLNTNEYYLDDILYGYRTNAPMPQIEHKNCLKLIAEACMCILYEDINGIIRIEPNQTEKYNFKLDFDDMYEPPVIGQSTLLKNINMFVYTYAPSDEHSELTSIDIETNYDELIVPIENAIDIDITGTAKYSYAGTTDNAIFFRNLTSGTIIITGRKIIKNEKKIITEFNNDGSDENVTNPLINNEEQAQELANFKGKYLTNRKTFTFNYRGNPELRSNNLINIQTSFSDSIPVRILRSKITKGLSIKGEIIAKNGDQNENKN